jgi:flagellar operon protein
VSHQPVDPALLAPGVGAPAAPAPPAAPVRSVAGRVGADSPAFGEVLARRTAGVQFSGHALQRIERRQIDVSPQTLVRLQEGVARAAGKGARESVVLVDGTAFVVSVKNRTVITAVDPGHMRDHVFTNIDSAVIA